MILRGEVVELKSLTIFQTVARLGSVSAAARELNYVQSNITMHIKQLEEKFGTTLFYRHQLDSRISRGRQHQGYCQHFGGWQNG